LHSDVTDFREQLFFGRRMHDRVVTLAQRGIKSRVPSGLRFRYRALGNVMDAELDYLDAFAVVSIGYDFNVDARSRFCS
jgi:hypothetical protein